jgi:hypothetical protein
VKILRQLKLAAGWLFDWYILPWLPQGRRDARKKAQAARAEGSGTQPGQG